MLTYLLEPSKPVMHIQMEFPMKYLTAGTASPTLATTVSVSSRKAPDCSADSADFVGGSEDQSVVQAYIFYDAAQPGIAVRANLTVPRV
jgi:hypothetical protein